MSTKTEATIEDLYQVDGKAELVNGEIVPMSPTGQSPHHAARALFLSLYEYERRTGGRLRDDGQRWLYGQPAAPQII